MIHNFNQEASKKEIHNKEKYLRHTFVFLLGKGTTKILINYKEKLI